MTEHQQVWGRKTQRCRSCNPLGVVRKALHTLPECRACNGSGWAYGAMWATEPWSEVLPRLYIGGHDYGVTEDNDFVIKSATPSDLFDVVISMYARPGFEPSAGTEHLEVRFPDSNLDSKVQQRAVAAAQLVAERLLGGSRVLVRCQAGLNRSSLVAGLAMMMLGYSGLDAVQLIRLKRSPWALFNDHYERFLLEQAADVIAGLPRQERAGTASTRGDDE